MAGRTRKTTTTAATTKNIEIETGEFMNKPIDSPEIISEEIKSETEEVVEEKVTKKVKTIDDFRPDDKILCHSIYSGKLLYTGGATNITYEFVNFGAKRYIQYQDLEHGLLAQKDSILSPLIIIDDAELLATDLWQEVEMIYDTIYDKGDLIRLIKLPTNSFKKEFLALPESVKKTVTGLVSTQINNGTFDSVTKAKIIDEDCNTSLVLMMQ